MWTLCGHCVAVPWPLKVQENEKKSTCGSSRRRAGPQGARGPWGPKGPGPARLLEPLQIDFFSFSWSFNGHGTATQCPHSVHTQEKSSFFLNLEFVYFRGSFFREFWKESLAKFEFSVHPEGSGSPRNSRSPRNTNGKTSRT